MQFIQQHTKKVFLLTVLSFSLILAGCSTNKISNNTSTSQKGEGMNGSSMMHSVEIKNEEDFLQNMIPHHVEAVDTSKIVTAQTSDPELKKFTVDVITVQSKEIDQMKGWLKEWYDKEYTVNSNYAAMMGDLKTETGKELEKKYLEGMISHHEGAIEMAEQVLTLNPRPEIKKMAEDIISLQQTEVEMMQGWLKTKYGTSN